MRAVSIDKLVSDKPLILKKSKGSAWIKRQVLKRMEGLVEGYLLIEDQTERYSFGDPDSSLQARVVIVSPECYQDIFFNGTVGAGEAYIKGLWYSDDLLAVIRVLCANITVMQSLNSRWSVANEILAKFVHRFGKSNNKKNSKLNIAAHYDLGNDFFKLFLDTSMMYSAAIFPKACSSLEEAASYKLEHICQRLQLTDKDHLLEIGTGWGGMAIYAAKHYGCRVTTTTISKEQYEYARQQVKQAGLDDKITVLLNDYRDLEGRFDKLVSIEMIEAVGHKYYPSYFSACSHLLKPNGIMLIQAITMPDQRYESSKYTPDFIQRYIFPGGELPCIDVMSKHLVANTDMQVVGIEDITLHYAKTLAAWRQGFFSCLDDVRQQGFSEEFIRMWEFYLCYCEGGFRERTISTIQMLIAKPRCKLLPSVKV